MIFDEHFDHRIVSGILTKDQLAAIGSVVVESTFCEEIVESIIWRLSGLDEDQGKYFTNSLNMNSRLDLLSSLGKPRVRSQSKKAEFTKLISALKEANNDRNVIVHGKWQSNGVGVFVVMNEGPENHPPAIVKKRRLNSPPLTKGAQEIEAMALTLARLTMDLVGFSRTWKRRTSPRKPLSPDPTH